MVEPARCFRIGLAFALALAGSGCGLVPTARLDECHREAQSLRAETAQLKDVNLKLRAHNQDLAQRGVEDERRLKALGESNDRLEHSVQAYQEERDELAAAFEEFKRRLAAGADQLPRASLNRFEPFRLAHPECAIDPAAGMVSIPAPVLFEPGTAQWRPEARAILNDLAKALTAGESGDMKLCILADAEPSGVRRASTLEPSQGAEGLPRQRASQFREQLAKLAGMDASAIELGGLDSTVREGKSAPGPGSSGPLVLRLSQIDGSAADDLKP
jgi:outer membrane protein OmpA-like peptidoglycan-associated protein